LRHELGVPPGARFVATIGQLGLRKATDVALTAALQIAHDVPDVHWLIVGERTSAKQESLEFEALLHELATEPRIAGRVHFLGRRTDIAQLLNECVLFLHSARQEPLGRVLLEAAASGVPVVATDVGGAREIFPAEWQGAILVPPDNRLAMANAMLGLLRDERCRRELAQAARLRAIAAFDIRVASERLIAQYRIALGS
jgi:glycosyltransferase involved in cell wall biosynthesis